MNDRSMVWASHESQSIEPRSMVAGIASGGEDTMVVGFMIGWDDHWFYESKGSIVFIMVVISHMYCIDILRISNAWVQEESWKDLGLVCMSWVAYGSSWWWILDLILRGSSMLKVWAWHMVIVCSNACDNIMEGCP